MPELPEVECWGRRVAERACRGKVIADVTSHTDDIVFADTSAAAFSRALKDRRVDAVHRRGKQMWFDLAGDGPHPLLHFGMSGRFHVYTDPHDAPAHGNGNVKWVKTELVMGDGTRLAMSDKRRFARLRLADDPLNGPPLDALGPDALTDLPPPTWWLEHVPRRRTAIKSLLLDQSFLAGVGNWIADEVLYQARLDPHRRADTLTDTEISELRKKTKYVIDKAVEYEADYDRFPDTWLFHHRWQLRDSRKGGIHDHDGRKVAFDKIGGRTTSWVPQVQT